MQPIDPGDVRAALDRMLASEAFVNAGRLSRMLRFVVERTLDGQGGQLKEYLLGVEVFDRPSDYDPRMDSIVRVEARRLRAKLAEYYEDEGAGDPLRIRMAKGGYAPTFERLHEQSTLPASPARRTRMFASRIAPIVLAVLLAAAAAYIWSTSARVQSPQPVVTVAVLPFHVFSGRADDRRLADRLADGVTTELARVAALGVAAHTSARQYRDPQRSVGEIGQALGVKVVMEGTAHIDAQMVRLEIRLVDSALGRKLWVESFTARSDDLDGLERTVAQAVTQFLLERFGPKLGSALRRLTQGLMRNLKLAFRTLFRTPFVTVVAVISLALGIGATAAIFSLFNQMLLRPLPVRAPEELVNLSAPGPKPGSTSCNQAGDCDEVFSYRMFRDLENAQGMFTGLAAHRIFGANLAYKGQTLSGSGMLVSGSYFPLLRVQPALGRIFAPGDDRVVGESRVVVLSFNYWQKRFGLNPAVLNDALVVNGQSLTIVGVAPRGFDGTTLGSQPEVFVPITLRALMEPGFEGFENRRAYWAYVFGRLKPGVSLEQAKAGIDAQYKAIINDVEAPLQTGMSEQTMKRFRARQLGLTPGTRGQSSASGEAKGPLTLLLGVTGLVLLIACANIANLLLARAASRASEMGVRLSLGASRWQLIAQLLTESLVLAVIGGAAGLLVARWTLDLIVSILPDDAQQFIQLSLDAEVLLFAAALTIGTGLLFGLFPAIHSTRPDLAAVLKGQSGKATGTKAAARFRTSLATTQIALSMALLVAAGLFTRSLFNISRVDLGLKIDNLVTFGISPELNGYAPARSLVLFQRLEDALTAVPGVVSVTSSLVPALAGSNWGSSVQVQGFKSGPDIDNDARFNEVGAGYFKTMGVPLIAGREFTRADNLKAPKVAIVNEEFAKKFNLGREAVGKLLGSGPDDKLDTEIVGLVQNAKYSEVKDKIPPLFFRPYAQDDGVGAVSVYVRTALDPEEFLATLPRVVAQIDPNLPLENLRTMPQQVRQNVFLDRFISLLSAAFACLATLLAAIGLYGVLAYTVAQRTREIGLRMALGAAPSRVRGMVLRQVAMMTLVGGAIGLGGAVWLARLAESLLYELKGHDPLVLVGAAVVLSVVALIAGFIPAHRASQVEPMHALRYE